MKHATFGEIEIYAVGLLADLARLVHSPEPLRQRLARFRRDLRHPLRHVCARDWWAVRRYLNGYLCEPADWPPEMDVRRCGTGWTRGGAYRDLARRAEKAGVTVSWESR